MVTGEPPKKAANRNWGPHLRALTIGAAVLTTAALLTGTAHAAAPSNDDFDQATTITALPFSSTVDTGGSTVADDDPTDCTWSAGSVWLRYTAPADGFVRMTADRPTGDKPAISAYTGERGALTWTPGACRTSHGRGSNTFAVAAGTTYHFLVQDIQNPGPATFGVELVPAAPNDDFAGAVDVPLDTDIAADSGPTSSQAGEPVPHCEHWNTRSLWYRYTPDRARIVSAKVTNELSTPSVTVFRGTALDALTEVDCVHTSHTPAVFATAPGETYYLRVADGVHSAGALTLRLEDAPRIAPTTEWIIPNDPGVFDDVRFIINPGDPAGRWLAGGEVQFGDGTSAEIPAVEGAAEVFHRYADDGAYELTITGHTADGRSGSTTQTLRVETHDVTVSNVTAPATATAGDTGQVQVSITNTRYTEDVVVELLRRRWDGYFDIVGTVPQHITKDSTAVVPFTYTYTDADAALGRATLKARVRLTSSTDNNPTDNERTVETTITPTSQPWTRTGRSEPPPALTGRPAGLAEPSDVERTPDSLRHRRAAVVGQVTGAAERPGVDRHQRIRALDTGDQHDHRTTTNWTKQLVDGNLGAESWCEGPLPADCGGTRTGDLDGQGDVTAHTPQDYHFP
ncbi:hypothetical protein [Umezawaea sp.]|uniref:hypothetical protein n=1 Tax=Umezawaea sp. TaxID=1955258 RepID=UPI002ED3D898